MLDFKELDVSGVQFELLVRELLFALGHNVAWSGVGSDGGRDLLCLEGRGSVFGEYQVRWLIQCKHFAHADRNVGLSDLDNIVDSCSQHRADGYIVASSTSVSSALVARLEALSEPRLRTNYWDAATIERLLSTPSTWAIAQRFFPLSSGINPWNISYTTEPNRWIVNYRGHHFHLTNRIGSNIAHHFTSVPRRIDDIESISFPAGHFIRIRAIWYNDKSNEYIYYL